MPGEDRRRQGEDGPIRLLLFDINGVLYDYDRPARIARLASITGRTPAAIDTAIWTSGFEDRGDAGDMDAAAYLAEFGARLGFPLTLAQWEQAAQASLAPVPDMLAIAERLRGSVALAALTNNNLLVRDRMDSLFPALRPIFGDRMFASSAFRLRKPDPAVYRHALAALGAAPEATLFIDDSRANVEGAVAAGLHGHHHTDAAAFAARLASFGLAGAP